MIMLTNDGSVDFSVVVGVYIEKVNLETTDLISSLSKEITVMHTVNRQPEKGWADALKSAQKITEFIKLFCKKSSRKCSLLALVVLDKLQAAHNKYLDAARTNNIESTFKTNTTAAELLQQSAKFFTYALIAERSGQTVFRDLYIKAGETSAEIAAQQHRIFESADVQWHWKCVKNMIMKVETQTSLGNIRGSKVYATAVHYHKALAAIAMNNVGKKEKLHLGLVFHSAGLKHVFESFESMLVTIARFFAGGTMWQAEVLLWELENHQHLLDPAAKIEDNIPDIFADIITRVASAAGLITSVQHAYLNDWAQSVPAVQIVKVLRLGPQFLSHYVQLQQDECYLNERVLESQTNMHTQKHFGTPFYRLLWKHIHRLSTDRLAITKNAMSTFLHTASSRSEAEWRELHHHISTVHQWMDVTAVLDDALVCLDFYTQQLQSVRSDRPVKAVEVVTRGWRSAQFCMQQLLIDVEASVCKGSVFLLEVTTMDLQDVHNAACLRARTYARIAQNLYQNMAGFCTEMQFAQHLQDQQCTEALTNLIVHLATLTDANLTCYDTIPSPREPEHNLENILSDALERLKQIIMSRNNMVTHATDLPRAELWRIIYSTQVLLMWHKLKGIDNLVWEFGPTLELLIERATQYEPIQDKKTLYFLLLSADIYRRCLTLPLVESIYLCEVSEAYSLAAHAQYTLSKLTHTDFTAGEDVAVTVARMLVDRYSCAALYQLDYIDNQRKSWIDEDAIREKSLLGKMHGLLFNRDISENDSKQRQILVWENTVVKQVFAKYLPHLSVVCEQLQDYDLVLTKQQIAQIPAFLEWCQERYTCRTGLFYAKRRNTVELTTWWMRALKALEAVRVQIYSHCFDAGPMETISARSFFYEAIKQCAAAYADGKLLHASCPELADLVLNKFKPVGNSLDDAARAQHVVLCKCSAQFLAAAITEDTTLIDLALDAVNCQKRRAQESKVQQFSFPADCKVAAANSRVKAHMAHKLGETEIAEQFHQACALFVEAEKLYTTDVAASGRRKYRERASEMFRRGVEMQTNADALKIVS